MESTDLQIELLKRVLKRYPKNSEGVNELMDRFNLSQAAVYRRIKGDTLLTPAELVSLAQIYDISLDQIVFENTNKAFFGFNATAHEIKDLETYLKDLKAKLDQFGQIPSADVWYPTNDIPIFYYCFFPELISFKLYVWGRNIWEIKYLEEQNFHFKIIDHHVLDLCQTVVERFVSVSTTEMWGLNLFDSTLNQIEYHACMGGFEYEEEAYELCDKLSALADHFCSMAKSKNKFLPGKSNQPRGRFELYYNEMISTDNTIFLKAGETRAIFTTYGSPNFLMSHDDQMCEFTENWIKKIMAKSTNLNQNEVQRNLFFKGIKKRIEHTKARIYNRLNDLF